MALLTIILTTIIIMLFLIITIEQLRASFSYIVITNREQHKHEDKYKKLQKINILCNFDYILLTIVVTLTIIQFMFRVSANNSGSLQANTIHWKY
jgi:hypothetical protein